MTLLLSPFQIIKHENHLFESVDYGKKRTSLIIITSGEFNTAMVGAAGLLTVDNKPAVGQ